MTARALRRAAVVVIAAVVAAALGARPAAAHTLSDGYVDVTVDGHAVTGRVDLAARDLHDILGLDTDRDGLLRWREIEAGGDRIRAYVRDHLSLRAAAGPCPMTLGAFGTIERADGTHVSIALTARCPGPAEPLTIDYRAVFGIDARHNGLVTVRSHGGRAAAVVRGPGAVTLAAVHRTGVVGAVRAGARALWRDLDHLLFVVALLLPAVLRRTPGRLGARPRDTLDDAAAEVLVVAGLFAAAHACTFALAASGWINMPRSLTAALVALSLAGVAIDNLLPLHDRRALAAGLGAVHGFAFASSLAALGTPEGGRFATAVGYLLGLELGLLALVVVFLPAAFALRRTRSYRVLLVVASLAMAALALHWSYQRVFG
ncbi:MAG TPA: HupE/UreJ family protein [Kofleriaceae bacterium]|nr:HupE/UreJ family protein [Kofleriaceae bacterium]